MAPVLQVVIEGVANAYLSQDQLSAARSWYELDSKICNNPLVRSTRRFSVRSRFNACNVANTSSGGADMQTQKDQAIKYFAKYYKKLLEENVDEYMLNFESYRSQ